MTELVWKGKIVKKLPDGNFECLFLLYVNNCSFIEMMTNNQTEHIWVCKEESGFLSEIVTFRRLTPVEINKLNTNKNIETICPKGVIICANCGQIIYGDDKETKNKYLRNIKNIKG